jgi:drug/metabolite transporter (DMT)-like permease
MIAVAANAGIGFGLLSALALRQVSSVHLAVIAGLIPAATAGMAAWRAGERPSGGYWAALTLGLAAVIGFALIQGGGQFRVADLLILVAIGVAGVGYAEGGILAREFAGWRIICWAVVLALPVSLPVTIAALIASPPSHVIASAAAGLAYVGMVSVCLGFFAWYQAMARGGVAAIGKLQLAQPALTLGWSALLLGERVTWLSGGAAAVVIAATAIGRNAKVGRPVAAAPRAIPEVGRANDQVSALM